MRWTGRIRFVFLLPAVVWVLAFTVFPLGYSLYLAFFKIESKVEVTRERVPVLDEAGEPVLLSSGKPKTENVVHANQVDDPTFIGCVQLRAAAHRPSGRDRDLGDRGLRADRGADRSWRSGCCWPCFSTSSCWRGRSCAPS